jgi:hypothetical protein
MKQLGFEAGESPHEQAARRYDEAHPELFALVCRFALEAVRAGRRRIGIAAVWERIRWHFDVERDPSSSYRLNNSFRAYYARRFAAAHPEHAELFETRRLRSRRWNG